MPLGVERASLTICPYQVESSQTVIRIVGLSATLPNYIDVADFLRFAKYLIGIVGLTLVSVSHDRPGCSTSIHHLDPSHLSNILLESKGSPEARSRR